MTVWVDDRWIGNHGIGRFAREVIARLDFPHRPLRSVVGTARPLDVVVGRRPLLAASDVVFSPGFNAGPSRARQLLVIHDLIHLDHGSRFRRLYFSTVVRPAVEKAGVVLTISETSRARIADWLSDSAVAVVNVGSACSPDFEGYGRRHPPLAEDEHFLFVGSERPHKNLRVVLEALRQRPAYRLRAVVPDPGKVHEMAQDVGVSADAVTCVSGVSDAELAGLYASCRGVVMPSTVEGFGYPALEARECGTRTAYWTGCASVREICGDDGVPVGSSDDAAAWADALDRLAADPRIASTSDRGPESTWPEVAERVSEVLQRLAVA